MHDALTEARFEDSARLGATAAVAESAWIVMKFGGSSLATPENWATFSALVAKRVNSGLRPIVVLSALKGVTNLLEEILDKTCSGLPAAEMATLRQLHLEFARDLGLTDPHLFGDLFENFEQQVRLLGEGVEVAVPARARAIAHGELFAARLAMAYLQKQNIGVLEEDARDLLISSEQHERSAAQRYLSAVCEYHYDAELEQRLQGTTGVVVTQGYIASNNEGETVLLGREGSDTSAAYIAAKLRARRLEIWTDVPGMFSADPRLVPSARLLVDLSYDEAQELSSTGSRVLHPRCIAPLREDGIPLFVRCTSLPELQGTTVSGVTRSTAPQVKGISVRTGVTLISMEGASMWQEAGFLASAFAIFSDHDVSVDLVSTSESSVVVSIDATDGILSVEQLQELVADLADLCQVRVIDRCAVISLIGRRIRAVLSIFAPAFTVFEEENIHLISQAANDLNFSFVVDQALVPKVIEKFHSAVIDDDREGSVFGPTWEEAIGKGFEPSASIEPWWRNKRDELLLCAEMQPDTYVYDADSVRDAARELRAMSAVDCCLYAMKANSNADILRILASEGINFDCVSPQEVNHLRQAVPGLANERILLTLNFASRTEYEWAISENLQLTLDNLYPLQAWPEIFDGQQLFIRMDPGKGRGHHEHVKTAGVQSKFGIPIFEIDELVGLLAAANATVVGIHAHSGSGILEPDNWRVVAEQLVNVAKRFPEAHILDLGGGLGVPEKPGEIAFDVAALDDLLAEFKDTYPGYRLWLEPGRFLVARAGVLLSRVTQTKGKGDVRYVGVGAGMNSFIRPALYGAYHEIVNLSRLDEPATISATVVGPICETGDKFGSNRLLPICTEGDVMLIANTGAYGHVMGSTYNLREIAPEVVLPESTSRRKNRKTES